MVVIMKPGTRKEDIDALAALKEQLEAEKK